MTQRYLPTIALVLVASVAMPLATAAQTVDEATSSIEIGSQDGAIEWKVKNRTYDVVSFWPAGAEAPRTLLLAQNVALTRRTDMDGSQNPKVRVDASDIGADGALTPAWKIEAVAEAGSTAYLGVFGEAYRTTLYGCCGALDAHTYYSLVNGKKMLTANGQLALLEVPNSRGLIRLAGVETPWSATQDSMFLEQRDLLGVITYASHDGAIERVALRIGGDDFESMAGSLMALPELEWVPDDGSDIAREITLWALDGETDSAKLSGVTLRVTYTPDAWVEIPLLGDRLDLASARLAPNLAVEALP
jgi:hypothetical protein